MTTPFFLLLVLVVRNQAEITSSSDLNCNFSSSCQWRNATNGEDSGDWVISTHYEADPQHVIIPRKDSEGYFAHTSGFMGRTVALLVSDVASCQLGGGNVKYWYYKTGTESQLEVCTRQPPGSREPNSLRCYDGLSPSFAQQWIFRVVELPPLSQPFELIFRGTFFPPLDVIALTDIVYNSALCDAQNQRNRKKRLTPHLIGIHDWEDYRQSGKYRGETMIIVSQEANITEVPETIDLGREKHSPEPGIHNETTSSSTTNTPATTTTTTTTTFIAEELFSTIAATTTDPLTNFMNLLRQTAPVLPYIPTLVKTLQLVDFRDPSGTGAEHLFNQVNFPEGETSELRRSPVQASHFYSTESIRPEVPRASEPTLVEIAKKFGILGEEDIATTLRPIFLTPVEKPPLVSMRNIYGMPATTAKPELIPTVYPPSLVKNSPASLKVTEIKPTVGGIENEELRKLHSKMFKRKEEQNLTTTNVPNKLVVFKKPTQTESELATKLTELSKYLPTGATDDLKMLREIPDLEGLTRGMDLTLVSKPGGFAKLKKQFVDRLMRRTMGLPFNDIGRSTMGSGLPPPIIPVKSIPSVFLNSENTNSGADQGAGGTFGTDGSNPKLVAFSEGNDVEFTTFNQNAGGFNDLSTHRDSYRRALNFAAPTADRSSSSDQSSPRVGAAFIPACSLVDCTFDDSTLCNYVTSTTEENLTNGTLKNWAISGKPVLNSLTGIPHDLSKTGSYIYAGGTSVSLHDTYILSTKLPFEIKENSRLDFFVYQAGIKGRLQVCINTINNCALNIKGETIDVKARRWKNYHVPLTASTHVIHFVADGLQDNYAIGLDQIQLLNKYGMAAQTCK
ncbi:hypothetical protein RB195_002527 [Necator americanus]|uniref:MAM domain-containing protein n=1 Tax=Necator americanus TaxID=51031 RepID=A0ABR1DK74_NECAM